MMLTMNNYDTQFKMFQAGIISLNLWNAICMVYLHQVLDANRDVLVRLKNR